MAQDAFALCSQLLHRSIAALIAKRGARFEAVDAKHIEGKLEDELRSLGEGSRSPEFGPDRKSPVGREECRAEGANVNQADRRVRTSRHDGEADVLPGDALPLRPPDVTLEPFHGRWRRRNEPRYFFSGQQREERTRITSARLAQDDASSDQFR
jgi:hypothetical protein